MNALRYPRSTLNRPVHKTLLFQALACGLLAPAGSQYAVNDEPAPQYKPEDLVALAGALETARAEVKAIGEELKRKSAESGTELATVKAQADTALTKFNELHAQFKELEQKQIRGPAEPARVKSFGEQIAEHTSFDAFKNRGFTGGARMEIKTVTSGAVGTGLIRPQLDAGIVSLPRRRFTIRDLLTVVPTTAASIDYAKQTTRTNNAAPVAEAAAKPYSDFAWTLANVPTRVIAHLAKLTRQAMDDAPRIVAEVDSEMRYGLGLVEEAQILSGDGTGQNLNGIIPQATAYVAPITITSPTRIDMIRLAMLQAAVAGWPADGIVVSEYDWAGVELTKTSDGAYLFANPQGQIDARLWGLPVVPSPAMAIDKFLVGSFKIGATLYDRMGIEVLISTENADDFEKNLATMRAEERIALAVKRPGSFIYGDFGLVA